MEYEVIIKRSEEGIGVTAEAFGKKLDTYYEWCKHSPDGFNTGYNGSGPSQLAFAIIMDYLIFKGAFPEEAARIARGSYVDFREKCISKISRKVKEFTIKESLIFESIKI
jgi:hypothetical protein